MKTVLLLPLAFLLSCSAPVAKREVSQLYLRGKLEKELGPRDDGLFYVWTYQGSDEKWHYFHRQLGAMFNKDNEDGFYLVHKDSLNLGRGEFVGPSRDSSNFLDVTINQNGGIKIAP